MFYFSMKVEIIFASIIYARYDILYELEWDIKYVILKIFRDLYINLSNPNYLFVNRNTSKLKCFDYDLICMAFEECWNT